MNRKKIIARILVGLILLTAVGTVVAYGIFQPHKPWLAFYIACCGGVLVFNFLASLFLINKNLKK